jgi:hypothetical protein
MKYLIIKYCYKNIQINHLQNPLKPQAENYAHKWIYVVIGLKYK